MWAQLIKANLKPGKGDQLEHLSQQFQAAEQPGSGLVRSSMMRDQNNPSVVYMTIVVESEEKAQAREQDPRREEGLARARATMAEIFITRAHILLKGDTTP